MKTCILTGLGALGGIIASAFGGFDAGIVTLITFMGIDYLSGLVVAGVYRRSEKSENGALNSVAGFKGLIKKCMCLLMVLISHQLDTYIGTAFVRDAVVIALMCNELISIIENAGIMGIPIPGALVKAIDILNRK
jgi:toxin secretion/phage lysis holin